MISSDIWFPEPESADETYALRGESALAWISRSTIYHAVESRRFLNESLNRLPYRVSSHIYESLRKESKWDSALFELIVARMLQELGAVIEAEQANCDGKRPDFKAQFLRQSIVLEVTSPVFESSLNKSINNNIPLLNIVEQNIPDGWAVGVLELPSINPNDSKKEFKQKVQEMLNISPPDESSVEMELITDTNDGVISFYLWPKEFGQKRLAVEGGVSYIGDSVERIQNAVKQKRRQVRATKEPVILAIRASFGTSLADYDMALFGHWHEKYGKERTLRNVNFISDGVFNKPGKRDPTYAGVLSFRGAGLNFCSEPVLYIHPRYTGEIPAELSVFEQRRYSSKDNKIYNSPPTETNFMKRLNFANLKGE